MNNWYTYAYLTYFWCSSKSRYMHFTWIWWWLFAVFSYETIFLLKKNLMCSCLLTLPPAHSPLLHLRRGKQRSGVSIQHAAERWKVKQLLLFFHLLESLFGSNWCESDIVIYRFHLQKWTTKYRLKERAQGRRRHYHPGGHIFKKWYLWQPFSNGKH